MVTLPAFVDQLLEQGQDPGEVPEIAVTDATGWLAPLITRLLSLRQEMLGALRAEKARGVVLDIVEDLIGYPLITVSQAAKLHSVTFPPANNAIERLVRLGFLVEMTGRGYGRVFACPDVMATVEDPHLT